MNPRYERWRRLTFAITWLIYASYYLTRQSFSVAKVALEQDERVTMRRGEFGLVDSAFLTAYMLGQFVFGPLGDRFGPRRILLCGMGVSVLAAAAAGLSTTLLAFVVLAVVQGIAQSTGWSNTSKTMSSWFSVQERGRVIGWWCTHYTVGAAVALPFAGWMMSALGGWALTGPAGAVSQTMSAEFWPAAFWGPAVVLAIVMLLGWLLLRNRPEDVGLPPIEAYRGRPDSASERAAPAPSAAEGSWAAIREVLSARSIWLLAAAYFSIKLTRYAFYFWGPKFVYESLRGDAYASALTAAAMPIGGLVGVVGIGYVSDKLFQARRAPAVILSLLATVAVMLVGLARIESLGWMALYFFLVGMFLFGPDSMISATAAIDFGTKRGAGTATGFINGVGSIGGILGGFLPGVITTGTDWSALFEVCLIGLTVSAAMLVPLWRVKPPVN